MRRPSVCWNMGHASQPQFSAVCQGLVPPPHTHTADSKGPVATGLLDFPPCSDAASTPRGLAGWLCLCLGGSALCRGAGSWVLWGLAAREWLPQEGLQHLLLWQAGGAWVAPSQKEAEEQLPSGGGGGAREVPFQGLGKPCAPSLSLGKALQTSSFGCSQRPLQAF